MRDRNPARAMRRPQANRCGWRLIGERAAGRLGAVWFLACAWRRWPLVAGAGRGRWTAHPHSPRLGMWPFVSLCEACLAGESKLGDRLDDQTAGRPGFGVLERG